MKLATAAVMARRGAVKNKTPAPIQITSEQLLREAWDHHRPHVKEASTVRFADLEELHEHQAHQRKQYEERLMRNRTHLSLWLRYAKWEASQHNVEHARSVYERALDIDPRHLPFWISYAEFEMSLRMVNHARNVFDRAVPVLPRKMDLWLKFAYMEEVLGNVKAARAVFLRGIEWRLPVKFYAAFVGFEERHMRDEDGEDGEGVGNALRRWCEDWPQGRVYERLALWERKKGRLAQARAVYEEAIRRVKPPSSLRPHFYREFAQFEAETCQEIERAAAIVKFAKSIHPDMDIGGWWKGQEDLSEEAAWIGKRRDEFKKRIKENPEDWSEWHSWMTLEGESYVSAVSERLIEKEQARENMDDLFLKLKEAPIENVQRKLSKKNVDRMDKEQWGPYAYLWVRYAVFLESIGSTQEASDIYKDCLNRICAGRMGGHMFSSIWILAAELEIRKGSPESARKLLGVALGILRKLGRPGDKVYERYIDLEVALGEVDRARTLFEKWVESAGLMAETDNERKCGEAEVLVKWAKMEDELSEFDRARALFEVAVKNFATGQWQGEDELDGGDFSNANVDMIMLQTELAVWRSYIDFEMLQSLSNVVKLYERLIERFPKGYVWRSYGEFASANLSVEDIRSIWKRGDESLHVQLVESTGEDGVANLRKERVSLLEAWKEWEESLGPEEGQVAAVEARLPKKVKRKRMLADQSGWEEYWDYMWVEEEESGANAHLEGWSLDGGLGILAAARKWKKGTESDEEMEDTMSRKRKPNQRQEEGHEVHAIAQDEEQEAENRDDKHNLGIFAAAQQWKKRKLTETEKE